MPSIPSIVVPVLVLVGAWWLLRSPAMALETPEYEVARRFDDAELRTYAPNIVAETEVVGTREAAASEGFRRLAGYIFGGNRGRARVEMTAPVTMGGGQRIAMTAPVTMEGGQRIAMTAPVALATTAEGSWRVQFTMPRTWTLDTLPVPDDARVVLRAVPSRWMLVRRYQGGWSEARRAEEEARVESARAREGLTALGAPVWARFDPPWKPGFLKHNEVWIEVAAPITAPAQISPANL